MLWQTHEGGVKKDNIQQTYRWQLQAQIIGLALDAKNLALPADNHEKPFNQQWQRWIRDLSQTKKPVAICYCRAYGNGNISNVRKGTLHVITLLCKDCKKKLFQKEVF